MKIDVGTFDNKITFHIFPKDVEIRNKWLNQIDRPNWAPTKYSIVCSKHFTPYSFTSTGKWRRLEKDAVPLLHLTNDKRKNSKHNNHSRNSNMNSAKRQIKKKKTRHNKTNIKTLFNALRRESQASISTRSSEPSIQSIDSTFENTVIETAHVDNQKSSLKQFNSSPKSGARPEPSPNSNYSSPKKRKINDIITNSPKRRKIDPTLIIIDEDDLETGQQPHETVIIPLTNRKPVDSDPCVSEDQTNNNKDVPKQPDTDTPLIKPKPNPLSINCSTPIIKNDKKNLQELIISNFPNNNSVDSRNFNEEVTSLTREINRDSYITIDLTEGTLNNTNNEKEENTVIDLANMTDDNDCTVVSVKSIQSMSGDSDVTVVNMSRRKREEKVHKYINRIANLDSSGKVLEAVMNKIFNGCKMVRNAAAINNNCAILPPKEETAEDVFIKEVILGHTTSRNSIGSNIYNPDRDSNKTGLRMVVIDGSNVAMQHGKGRVFSVKGLQICIDYFVKRGHVVKAFVPRFRCKFGKSSDPRLLDDLERRGYVVYTPSREIQGRLITSYDDRYIVQCAAEFDAVIVSGDNYRDLMRENPRWQFVIENRLLQFTWVNDMIMFPRDPLGRQGPTLENFLKHSPQTKVFKQTSQK